MTWRPLPAEPPGPRDLDASLARLAKELGAPAPRLLNQVFSHWEDIVGAELAAHARPLSLRRGTLVIGVDQPAWAAQLGYLKADLLARIRDAAGGEGVTDVTVRVAPR